MGSPRKAWALALAAWFVVAGIGLVAGAASAEDAKIPVNVLITHVSNKGSGIDPAARGLGRNLDRHSIAFDSIKVIEDRRLMLELDEVKTLRLPNGRKARVRPISRGEKSVLMAIDVEGAVKVDARVKRKRPFVIRAGRHDGGNLMLSLELDD